MIVVLIGFGGVIGVTQISNADEKKIGACTARAAEPAAPAGKRAATDPKVGTYTDSDGDVQHKGDGQLAKGETAAAPKPVKECRTGSTTAKEVNGLRILTDSCEDSRLQAHDGFQKGNRCVSTEFGEVGDQSKNPTLLITEFPKSVRANTPFTLKVSTRNLVRDRFLAAGQGGYYVESSVLTKEGLVRGHFHTACRMLESTKAAPNPALVPAFFVATEDDRGGGKPDTVTIRVPGLPQEGAAQCASWAGDGSHRIPMMQRANQTPAFDAVHIKVEGRGQADKPPADKPPADKPPADKPPAGNGQGYGNGNGQDNGDGQDGKNGQDGDGRDDDGGDKGEEAKPAATVTPKTGVPPKNGATKIPPTTGADAPKPARTKNVSAPEPAAAGNDNDEPAEAETSRPAQARKTTEPPAARDVSSDDDGAPDLQAEQNVQTGDNSKLALTGANSMTIILGGTLLVLCGVVIIGATRRRRAASRD